METGFKAVLQNCVHGIKLKLLALPYVIQLWLVVQNRRNEFSTFPVT